jgi:hypothetical protein
MKNVGIALGGGKALSVPAFPVKMNRGQCTTFLSLNISEFLKG